ncbi:hypothetical protein BAE44_0017157 [Dichanthelium oligosanthes]|uniref:Kazal-like domain-containing protein n=1 Tax=Dichanthelium oligosanthes TaxID=888268 RepID=A0A1E5V9Y2_9POAL|nr:hypothetical protein BAE44_0017157 [Dichanthelium oligosanthes]
MASSGAPSSLKVATTITVICIMLVLSSSPWQAAAQMLCSQCDQDCSSSAVGCASGFCGAACGDPTSSGCQSCKQAYFQKCKIACLNSCRNNCIP